MTDPVLILLYASVVIFLAGVFVIVGDAVIEHFERKNRAASRRLASRDRRERERREQGSWQDWMAS